MSGQWAQSSKILGRPPVSSQNLPQVWYGPSRQEKATQKKGILVVIWTPGGLLVVRWLLSRFRT